MKNKLCSLLLAAAMIAGTAAPAYAETAVTSTPETALLQPAADYATDTPPSDTLGDATPAEATPAPETYEAELSIDESIFDASYSKDVSGFVTRLYAICLDRTPDDAGLADWVGKLQSHQITGAEAAYGFIFSREFVNKSLCNDCYVTYLYRAFFDREPDSAGFNDWVSQLANGATRGVVFSGFVGSQEFHNLCNAYGISQGEGNYGDANAYQTKACTVCSKTNGTIDFVTRLYTVCLDRSPEEAGLADWVTKLSSHQISGSEAAYGFIFSAEFQNKNYCNSHYVEYLYKAFMGREYDLNGLTDWVTKLNNGTSREEVFNGFSQSNEFRAICESYGITLGDPIPVNGEGTKANGNCAACAAGKSPAATVPSGSVTPAGTTTVACTRISIRYTVIDTSQNTEEYQYGGHVPVTYAYQDVDKTLLKSLNVNSTFADAGITLPAPFLYEPRVGLEAWDFDGAFEYIIGTHPEVRSSYTFEGWYTKEEGGVRVTESTPIFTLVDATRELPDELQLYAHWSWTPTLFDAKDLMLRGLAKQTGKFVHTGIPGYDPHASATSGIPPTAYNSGFECIDLTTEEALLNIDNEQIPGVKPYTQSKLQTAYGSVFLNRIWKIADTSEFRDYKQAYRYLASAAASLCSGAQSVLGDEGAENNPLGGSYGYAIVKSDTGYSFYAIACSKWGVGDAYKDVFMEGDWWCTRVQNPSASKYSDLSKVYTLSRHYVVNNSATKEHWEDPDEYFNSI